MRRSGPSRTRSRYQYPATLPGLRAELMCPPSLNGRGQRLADIRNERMGSFQEKAPRGRPLWDQGLSFSREYDVRCGRRRHMLGARIAQRRQVHPRKERLTTAEQDRRDRDMHLVDEPRLEILAHRGRPAADLDIKPARGLPGATERFLNSAGDDMKDGPAFHRDRFARVVRQHEHRHVIRRVLAPPAAPPVVGPRPAHGAEHVSAHDIRTDAFPEALGKIVVGTRRPARFSVYLAKRARADVPAVQLLATHAEWVLQSLAGAGAVPVERDREVVDAQFGHGLSLNGDCSFRTG